MRLPTPTAPFSRNIPSERGSATVEAALVLPLLLFILLGTIDFGRVFYMALAVTHATRVGAEYGAQNTLKAFDSAGMKSAAEVEAQLDISGFTATAYPAGQAPNQCQCWDGTAETPMLNCAQLTASTSCGGSVRVYVRVDGSATFTTLINYPGIPHTIPITRTVWMRAQ